MAGLTRGKKLSTIVVTLFSDKVSLLRQLGSNQKFFYH
jgi:hypothetical protein